MKRRDDPSIESAFRALGRACQPQAHVFLHGLGQDRKFFGLHSAPPGKPRNRDSGERAALAGKIAPIGSRSRSLKQFSAAISAVTAVYRDPGCRAHGPLTCRATME
jgi:hypothetical protein